MFTFSVLDLKTILGKSNQKTQKCQFKLKFGTKTNLNIRKSVIMFTFQFLTGNTFLGKFGSKTQNCQFELKFHTRPI